jgi:FtsP/CotA-like multicopper oxidase with cupredoxin domain
MDMTGTDMNVMHGANFTNVHTHGLHIDPTVDSVFRKAGPGANITYEYRIPENHAPGLHWYHAHKHGSATFQVMNGLVGAIIVEPAVSVSYPASLSTMTQHVLVLSHMRFDQEKISGSVSQGCGNNFPCSVYQGCSGSGSSPFNPFRVYSLGELQNEVLATAGTSLPVVFGNSSIQSFYLVNGQWNPTVSLQPSQTKFIRMVHASGNHPLALTAPAGCTMSVVASDGVLWRAPSTRTTLNFVQAGRYEAVISCANVGTYSFIGRFGDEQPQTSQTIFTVVVAGVTAVAQTVTAAELAAVVRPSYLSDLTGLSSTRYSVDVHFSQGGDKGGACKFWYGMGSDCSAVWAGTVNPSLTTPNCPFAFFGGERGSSASALKNYRFKTEVGSTNELRLFGLGKAAHPFHLHVHHFQVTSWTNTPGGNPVNLADFVDIGEWRDTVPALDGRMNVRFVAADFPGETVIHCHFLRHEDLGMMDSIYVCPAGQCPPASSVTPQQSSAFSVQLSTGAMVLLFMLVQFT